MQRGKFADSGKVDVGFDLLIGRGEASCINCD